MLVLTLLALGSALVDQPTFCCPVMNTPGGAPAETFDYKGVRYYSCCAGCEAKFATDPEKYIKESTGKGLTVGQALYDPISRLRINPKEGRPSEVYHGVLFTFENAENKVKFDAGPAAFLVVPDNEVLKCPVIDQVVNEPGSAPSYFDADGMRIYLCCYGCINPSKNNVADLVAKAKTSATKATVHLVTDKDLKTEKELLNPGK